MSLRLSDLTAPPIVSETYLVPCVGVGQAPVTWLPVLGPGHSDPSFAPLLGRHIHYDPRFFDLALLRPDVLGHPQHAGLTPAQVVLVIAHRLRGDEVFAERPLPCLREMPAWPHGHPSAPWVPELEVAHRGCRVGAEGRCPHAGTDRRSFPRDADGAWTCIHGLRWGSSGRLLPMVV